MDVRPGDASAKFRPGNGYTLNIVGPAGWLSSRAYTATLDGTPLSVTEAGDTLIIVASAAITTAAGADATARFILTETGTGNDDLVGTWTASDDAAVSIDVDVAVIVDSVSATLTMIGTADGASGAPVDAPYLVTAAHAELSGEVVVGATPGGELAGTWPAPTVDALHAGSTHASVQAAAEATAAADATTKADAAQAAAVQRANHTGSQSSASISDFTEAVQDAVALLLGAGSNITLNYDDNANTLTVSSADTTDAEAVRDAIGIALVGVGVVSVAVNDGADTITISSTATVNATDAALRDRSTHTGTQTAVTISDFAAAALAATAATYAPIAEPVAQTHIDDTSAAHAASAIANTPAGGIAATTVQTALDELDTEKAPLASPALTGNPTAPTQSASNNSTRLATTAYADALVADALNNGTTGIAPSQNAVFDALALKAPLASPTFTGDVVVPDADAATEAMNRQTSDARYVQQSLYDANSFVIATSDNTPIVLTVAASRIPLRKSSGDIIAGTGAEAAAILAGEVFKQAQEFNPQTGTTYTLVAGDVGKVVTLSNASAITLTVPQDSDATIAVGTYVDLDQLGAGQVTVVAGTGATLRLSGLTAKSRAQYSRLSLQKVTANTWKLMGDLAAS